jgi:hypothetical protein
MMISKWNPIKMRRFAGAYPDIQSAIQMRRR